MGRFAMVRPIKPAGPIGSKESSNEMHVVFIVLEVTIKNMVKCAPSLVHTVCGRILYKVFTGGTHNSMGSDNLPVIYNLVRFEAGLCTWADVVREIGGLGPVITFNDHKVVPLPTT